MTQLQFNLNMDFLKDSIMNSNLDHVVKSTIILVLNEYMEKERDEYLKAETYERTEERQDYRNGYYERDYMLSIGKVKLRVPRTRSGEFAPTVFEKYRRCDQAFALSMLEMVVNGRFNIGTSITKRPKEIRKRETFGHWELDSVVSSRGKSKGCFATFVERKTRWYVAFKMPNRTSLSMEQAIRTLNERLPSGAFQTATVDRGKEFACYKTIEAETDIEVYFAEPYSSWQRGSNENANGLLREFFPKKTDLAKVSDQELENALTLINNRPRKCLNWKTTHEAFQEELLHLI